MIIIKKGLFDRIEQSFYILFSHFKNFLKLVLPIYMYKLIIGIFIWNFVSYVLLGNLDLAKTDIFSSPYYITIFFFILVGFILYITFYVGILLSTIKSVKDILNNKKIDLKANLKYGFNSIIPSFDTYWHIFAYIVLIPFYIISFGGVLFIIGDIIHNSIFSSYGLKILFFGLFILFIFIIYRGVKTYFSLTSAVDENSYTKQNFLKSVEVTNNNWLRIVGNFLLLSILLSIILSILGGITGIFSTGLFDIINIKDLLLKYASHNITENDINTIKTSIMTYYNSFYLNNFIVSIFDLFFNSIKVVFIIIFTYIFFKRLEFETFGIKQETKKEEL